MASKVAVIYYSSTGNVYALAQAIAEGAKETGAEVRLLKVKELAPDEAIASNQGWKEHAASTQHIPEASLADLGVGGRDHSGLADALRAARRAAQAVHRHHGPSVGPGQADQQGGFQLHQHQHRARRAGDHDPGDQQRLLPLGLDHRGPGYADPIQFQTGNPYGTSHVSAQGANPVGEATLAAARFQGKRVAQVAAQLKAGAAVPA